jgi:hypothetical protein
VDGSSRARVGSGSLIAAVVVRSLGIYISGKRIARYNPAPFFRAGGLALLIILFGKHTRSVVSKLADHAPEILPVARILYLALDKLGSVAAGFVLQQPVLFGGSDFPACVTTCAACGLCCKTTQYAVPVRF